MSEYRDYWETGSKIKSAEITQCREKSSSRKTAKILGEDRRRILRRKGMLPRQRQRAEDSRQRRI